MSKSKSNMTILIKLKFLYCLKFATLSIIFTEIPASKNMCFAVSSNYGTTIEIGEYFDGFGRKGEHRRKADVFSEGYIRYKIHK